MTEINDINEKFKGKKLLAFDETTGEFAIVSPHIFTSTVYTEEGVPLDEYLTFKPQELIDKLDDILKEAPKEYDTFREIAAELNTNKDSIVEILRAISNRVKMPENGKAGQVLKLNSDGEVVFDDDKDTVYTHPETHKAGIIETDTSHRFVSDKEKETWDKKLDKDSDLKANSITLNNQKKLLKDILSQIIKDTDDLEGLIGSANGIATLDGNRKVPVSQLPDEALRDTTYDLTPYAKSEDIESTYAKIRALTDLKNAVDKELKKYASQSGLDEEVRKINVEIDKKESTIHKGEVNGYAALDNTGKVPEAQLPEKALKTYDLTPYAKSEDIKKIYVNNDDFTSALQNIEQDVASKSDLTAYQKTTAADSKYATKEEIKEEIKAIDVTGDIKNLASKSDLSTLDNQKLDKSQVGKANGVASLDEQGLIPSSQLPSFVDDIIEYKSKSDFPTSGEAGKIYVDTSTNLTHRWTGSSYVEVSPSIALGQTSSTAFRGDYGKTAYDHALAKGNPHGLTAQDIANLGVKITDTIYTHPKTHPISMIDGLQAIIDKMVTQDTLIDINYVAAEDNRNDDNNPSWYMENHPSEMALEFKYRGSVGDPPINASSNSQCTLIATYVPWQNKTGGYPTQISFGSNLAIRQATSGTTWGSWVEFTTKNDLPTKLSDLKEDSTHRLVTDSDKKNWDSKPDVVEISLADYNNLTTKKPNTIYAID